MSRHMFRHVAQYPRRKLREARWFIQRGRRGWSDRDVWSLDDYLARVISGSVEHLRLTGHSVPVDIHEDDWESVLTRIETGLADYSDRWHDDEGDDEIYTELAVMRAKESLRLVTDHFEKLWD